MIDAHCHLQEFENPGKVIEGLDAVICCGAGVESSRKAVKLAKQYKEVYATVGIHPEENSKSEIRSSKQILKSKLLKLLKHPKVVAVGECGLDFTPETSEEEKNAQRELLIFNIDLAKETGLPLVIHCRNAFDDIFKLLDRTGLHLVRSADRPRNNPYDLLAVQMHCFTGNMEQMRECVKRGWYISLGGIVTFKSNHALRDVAKAVPEDKLLIETDAPYLAPEPVRGSRNTPVNVKIVAAKIAEVRNSSINQIEEITVQNARRLFGIA